MVHTWLSLDQVFGMISNRMTLFIQQKLNLSEKAKELQTNYFINIIPPFRTSEKS